MTVKLLTEHHFEFLSLKGDCTGLYESTLVKLPHCWKSHITTQICLDNIGTCCWDLFFPSMVFKLLLKVVRVFCDVLVAFLYFDICHLLVANIKIWKSHLNIREGSD